MISNKNRLKTGNVGVLNRASAGIGIAGLSGLAAAQSASAQTNFQSLPGADYVIDQATGAARVTYQGQLYQVNTGHYIINADGSISISSQAAATVAPGLSSTTVNTSGLPVDSSVLNAAADSGGGLFGGNSLLLGTSVLGAAAVGVGGYFLFESLNDDDDGDGDNDNNDDDIAPTMTIEFTDNSGEEITTVAAGQTVTVTLTPSEAITGFDRDDVNDAGGTLGEFTTNQDGTYTTTFTADDSEEDPSISIAEGSFSDAAGNGNNEVSEDVTKDTFAPTMEITFTDNDGEQVTTLAAGDTVNVTFTASEVVEGFDREDVDYDGGELGDLVTDDDKTFTTTFTADGTSRNPGISIAANKFTDGVGNENADIAPVTVTGDIIAPTMDITFDGQVTTLAAGETVNVTFTASEVIAGFDIDDVIAEGGTLTEFSENNENDEFTATFMAHNDWTEDFAFIVAANAFTDLAGNQNAKVKTPLALETLPTTDVYYLPDAAFDDEGTFDASTVGDFSELRYVGSDISDELSIAGISNNTTISISSQNNGSGTLRLTAADADAASTISVALNGSTSGGVTLDTLDLQGFAGTLNLLSIGDGGNEIATLNTSGAIFVRGSGDTAQTLEITEVGADVTSINAAGFSETLTVLGVTAAGSGNTATALNITGGDGNDDLTGGGGDDIINGGDGGDELKGGDGDDTINGGAGDDMITGGAGADILSGGEGADVFIFASGDTGFPTANKLDAILELNITDGAEEDSVKIISSQGQPVHEVYAATDPVGDGSVANGKYSFNANFSGDLNAAISDVKFAIGGQSQKAVFFEHGSNAYFFASHSAGTSADDVLIDLGSISITSMTDDGAGIFTFA